MVVFNFGLIFNILNLVDIILDFIITSGVGKGVALETYKNRVYLCW